MPSPFFSVHPRLVEASALIAAVFLGCGGNEAGSGGSGGAVASASSGDSVSNSISSASGSGSLTSTVSGVGGAGGAGGGLDRDSLVPGTYKPSLDTTGVLPGSVLTALDGDQIISVPGTVLHDCKITGRVLVRAANVTIRNCLIVGPVAPYTSSNTGLVDCNHPAASNVTIVDSTLVPQTPTPYFDAVIGHDYLAKRIYTKNVVDGFGVYNANPGATTAPSNVVIEASMVEELAYFSPDSNHPDNRTHNDGVQIQGNTGTVIRGNVLTANASQTVGDAADPNVPAPDPYNPSVTGQGIGVTPNVSAVSGLLIENNWIDYGASSITVIPGTFGNIDVGLIQNNRFGRGQPLIGGYRRAISIALGSSAIGMPASTGPDANNGNVFDDDQSSVIVYRQ